MSVSFNEKEKLNSFQNEERNEPLSTIDQKEALIKIEEKRDLISIENQRGLFQNSDSSTYDFSVPPPYRTDSPSTSISVSSKTDKTEPNNVVSVQTSRCDYHHLMIKDLGFETRRQLGLRLDLDQPNIANWKSLADQIGFSNLEIQNFNNVQYKTQTVLNETQVRFQHVSVGLLCDYLLELDRQDVITDVEPWFRRDLSRQGSIRQAFVSYNQVTPYPSLPHTIISQPEPFLGSQSTQVSQLGSLNTLQNNVQVAQISSSVLSIQETQPPLSENKPNLINKEFVPESLPPVYPGPSSSLNLPNEVYDAFLLYDVADKAFIVDEFLPRIENDAGIKLFIPGRDLPAGDFNYDAQLEAMLNRCPKLIVILSDEFFQSATNKWGLNIALALDPAARHRKIIPVVYKRITVPNVLGGINACDRTRVLEDSWFWDGLIRSMRRRN